MKFTDCIEIVGSKPTLYEGTKQYVSTGAVEEYFINKNSIEEYTYNERPSRADLVGKSGDILFAKMAETKKTLILDKETENYLFSTGFFAIRPKSGILTTKCLYYLLNSKNFLSQKDKNSSGATQKAITNAGLEKINVNIPLFSKQDQIVKQFDLLTDIIKKYQSQLKKLDSLIKSRFIEMFGDPVQNPLNWEISNLGNFIENANNGMARRGNDKNGKIVLRLVELQRGFINYSDCNRIAIKTNEEKYLLKNNDFLFARVNGNPDNVGRCSYYKDIGEEVYHNDHIIRVHFDENRLNEYYLNTLLNSEYGKSEFKKYIKTSAGQYTIAQDGISSAQIPIPPIELQNNFATFVQQIDKSKFAVQKSLEKAETLYKSLMQRYFA